MPKCNCQYEHKHGLTCPKYKPTPPPMSNNLEQILKDFNEFLKNWTGINYPHLIDSDENDGQRFREKLVLFYLQTRKTVIEEVLKKMPKLDCLTEKESDTEFFRGFSVALQEWESIIKQIK